MEEKKPKNSAAKIKANNKYVKKAYERIGLMVKKGEKQVITNHAKDQGESLNGFINRAIKYQMAIDSEAKSENFSETPKDGTENQG